MKNIALVAALTALLSTSAIGVAVACGSPGERAPAVFTRQKVVGVWPSLERDGKRTVLTLSYPRVDGGGLQHYMDSFEVVRDRALRRLERELAGRDFANLEVSLERIDATRWRVTGWSTQTT